MHSWKKKLVVSQLALACTLAITSQANAATNDISGQTYNTFHHYNDATYADDVYYDGYVGWNNYAADSYYNGDIYPVINNATVNGVISTYYWICPYISRHLLSLNPLQARCRRYSRG
ncbi:hypothetical protein RNP08_21320, partial [Escherichia coli]|nr:hypothetical protein [Escherichia coli]